MKATKQTHQESLLLDANSGITVVLECDPDDPSDYKWSASCPLLPSCFSEGRTGEEALANVRDVLIAYQDILREDLAARDIELVRVPACLFTAKAAKNREASF